MSLALFNLGPPDLEGPLAARAITQQSAAVWFDKYHYSGTIGSVPGALFFGIFRPDLAAVVAVSMAANPHGVAKKYGLTRWPGNWEITRVAVHPDAPRNTATMSIAAALHRIANEGGVRWTFSYADTAQGHHGGIYQGLNAVYVGSTKPSPGYLLDGVETHPRSIVSRFGTQGARVFELAAKQGCHLEKIDDQCASKHTYILPCGPTPIQRQIRRHLRQYAKPYPKRAEEVSREIRPGSTGEGRVRLPASALFLEGDE